jgi:hypothetical protein
MFSATCLFASCVVMFMREPQLHDFLGAELASIEDILKSFGSFALSVGLF